MRTAINSDGTWAFGKHRGQPIEEVPSDYLVWVCENVTDLDPDDEERIAMMLHRRGEYPDA